MPIPTHELDRLAAVATGRSRAALAVEPVLDSAEQGRLAELTTRREQGEPLQYLEGTAQFGPIEVAVDSRALIPRPETERLWEEAVMSLGQAGPGNVIVDVGTGSGVLALSLKHVFPQARVIATDTSADALDLAEENVRRTGLEVELLHGDLLEPLPDRLRGRVDLIVSNPPYVAEAEFELLATEIRDHEPRSALVAGPEGTEVMQRLAEEAYWWLGIGGWALCEIGEAQSDAALLAFGAYDREVRSDLTGRPRLLVARKGASCCV